MKGNVCATCETLRKDIAAAVGEQDKVDLCSALVSHVEHARQERDHHLTGVQESREEFTPTSKKQGFTQRLLPCSVFWSSKLICQTHDSSICQSDMLRMMYNGQCQSMLN